MDKAYRAKLQAVADEVVETLARKDDAYGSSWKSHGGFSAFFNLLRKWSRIETSSESKKFDVFAAMREVDGSLDAVKDLIGYSILAIAEVTEVVEVEPGRYEVVLKDGDT